MMNIRCVSRLSVTALAVAMLTAGAQSQVASGLLSPNVASEAELTAVPGFTPELVEALIEKRPFDGARSFDAFLVEQRLDEATRAKAYGSLFVHIDLNNASDAEMKLIPGVGKRMAHEFDEYRPWKSWKQFEREIGKYVDAEEVARLKTYCFIPLDLNTASDDDFKTIPGVGKRMAHEFEEYRPWKSKKQFEKEIGKYVDEPEVARLWRYMVIPAAKKKEL